MPRRFGLSARLALAFVAVSTLTLAIALLIIERTTTSSFQSYVRHQQTMQRMMQGAGGPPGMSDMEHGGMLGQAEDDFFSRVRLWVLAGGVGGAALATLAGLIVAGRITRPLRDIEDAAQAVARGDTSRRAQARGEDELADLARSFNHMAEELQRQDETRQRFIADVAHELRTPLAVLKGEIEALEDGLMLPSRERLASLRQETDILARLVEDLRTLSLADAGELRLQRRDQPASEVLTRGVEPMKEAAARAGVKLRSDWPAGLPSVDVDESRIAQVVFNLLSNAIRHTPAGGEIVVRAHVADKRLQVAVRDSGSGIRPDALPHVFDRFYRVDTSRSRESGGSGLGLTIAQQLVRAHGGEIWAANNERAPGATFTFVLPLDRTAGEPSAAAVLGEGRRRPAVKAALPPTGKAAAPAVSSIGPKPPSA